MLRAAMKITLSSRSVGMGRGPIAGGQANDCLPRPNGRKQRGGPMGGRIPGVKGWIVYMLSMLAVVVQ